MAEQNYFGYTSGHGVPSYLLDRIHDDSSIDSDGAPRIFANTHPTITSAKDTDSSTTSNISYSWSWDSMTNITDMSSWNSNSRTVTLENVSSLLQTSAYDESIDMRTMKSDSCSSFNEAESNDSNRGVIYETSLPSSTSIMDTIGDLIIGLNKFDDRQETFSNDYNSSSTAYHEIGEMFTPYGFVFS